MKSLLGTVFAKTPVPFTGRRETFLSAQSNQISSERYMQAYGSVGTLFAIVNRLASSTAKVDWKLYRKTNDGRRRYATPDGDDGRREVTVHAALKLLDRPNKYMTRQEFFETVQQHIDLTGEGWIVVGYAEGYRGAGPIELWPVRPDKMQCVKDADDFLAGYIYIGPDGEKIPLEVEDVIMLRMPNPLDPYRGMGPVQSIMVDLESNRYAAEWNRNFFKNNAVPGAVIELPEHLTDAEFDEFQERWRETHQGVSNAHRVGIIEYGGKFVESKFAQRDMQFAEMRTMSSEAIREAFGFPKPMLGGVDDVNRANAEAGEYVFSRWLLVDRLERWKGALNNELLALFGSNDLEFDYENPVPEDKQADAAILTSKANAAKTLKDAGWDPDQILETVGLPPMKYKEPPKPVLPQQQAPGATPEEDDTDEDSAGGLSNSVVAAQRFVVKAHMDENTCGPCAANNGKTYKNRAAAYADYPGGSGYEGCVGAKFGNECRCKVVKRGREE